SNPTHGTLSLNSDGSLVYVPALNFNGTDTFTYKASDGQAQSGIATVTITVQPATITTDLDDLVLCPQQSLRFSTTASGTGPFSYQWLKDSVDIAGATNQDFIID